jgi:hypothetical protein
MDLLNSIQIQRSSRAKAYEGDVEMNPGCNTDFNCSMGPGGDVIQKHLAVATTCLFFQRNLKGCYHSAEFQGQGWQNGHRHNPEIPVSAAHSTCAAGKEEVEAVAAIGLIDMWKKTSPQDFEGKGLEISSNSSRITRIHTCTNSCQQHTSNLPNNSLSSHPRNEIEMALLPHSMESNRNLLSKEQNIIDPANLSMLDLGTINDICAVPVEIFVEETASITRRQCLEVSETLQQPATLSPAWGRNASPQGQHIVTMTSSSIAEDTEDQKQDESSDSMSYQSVESSRQSERQFDEVSADFSDVDMDRKVFLSVSPALAGIN